MNVSEFGGRLAELREKYEAARSAGEDTDHMVAARLVLLEDAASDLYFKLYQLSAGQQIDWTS